MDRLDELKKESDVDLKKEFDALRSQVSELLTALKTRGEEESSRLKDKLSQKAGEYKDYAGEKMHNMYDAGDASINMMRDQIRRNPVVSLLIALGVGYLISKISE